MAKTQHGTLGAGAVTTVTLDGGPGGILKVTNAAVAGAGGGIFFTVRSDGQAPADPTVGGAGTYVARPGLDGTILAVANPKVVVKLIATAADPYHVELLPGLN